MRTMKMRMRMGQTEGSKVAKTAAGQASSVRYPAIDRSLTCVLAAPG
jgi:hypothetical protein